MGTEIARPGAAELRALLDLPGLSPEQLDEVLEVAPGTVRGWRDGLQPIPKGHARTLVRLHENKRAEARVEALRLPECPIARGLFDRLLRHDQDSKVAQKELDAHQRECELCQENNARIFKEVALVRGAGALLPAPWVGVVAIAAAGLITYLTQLRSAPAAYIAYGLLMFGILIIATSKWNPKLF